MSNRWYLFLGLAAKARKITSGEEKCLEAVRSNNALLLIIAKDASENTKKRFLDKCKYRGVEVRIVGEKVLLGKHTGKSERSVVAILDENFAKRLKTFIDEERLDGGGE